MALPWYRPLKGADTTAELSCYRLGHEGSALMCINLKRGLDMNNLIAALLVLFGASSLMFCAGAYTFIDALITTL